MSKEKGKDATKEVLEDLAQKSVDNRAKGKKDVQLSLTDDREVEIIKDGKYLKKGQVVVVSELTELVFRKKGLIK